MAERGREGWVVTGTMGASKGRGRSRDRETLRERV